MSAVESRPEQLGLPVRVRKVKRAKTLTARDRIDVFGHLSHEEKAALRVLVDQVSRAKYGVPTDRRPEVRTRCAAFSGAFGVDLYCRNLAVVGGEYCRIHGGGQ